MSEKKFIDLKKIFRDKNPRLARMMPGFILNYLRRVIHEDGVNAFIEKHGEKMDIEFVRAGLQEFNIHVISKGEEYIPQQGGFVIASNHPLGGLDAFALMHIVAQKRKDIKFIVNDILLQMKNLKGLFAGVNKHGANAQKSLQEIDALYASGQGVLIFPAGLVSRKQNGEIKDLEWKKSFITKAKKYKLNIIPVHIEGQNTQRFYNLANWRKKFGITANIEMFFLVDELFKQTNKTITITFGEPVSWAIFDKSQNDHAWAEWMKEKVYGLKV